MLHGSLCSLRWRAASVVTGDDVEVITVQVAPADEVEQGPHRSVTEARPAAWLWHGHCQFSGEDVVAGGSVLGAPLRGTVVAG